jgi:hypothetical protein
MKKKSQLPYTLFYEEIEAKKQQKKGIVAIRMLYSVPPWAALPF